jgi:hypothetical protein
MSVRTNLHLVKPQETMVDLRDKLRTSQRLFSPQDLWAINEMRKVRESARMWGCVFLFVGFLMILAVLALVYVAAGGEI